MDFNTFCGFENSSFSVWNGKEFGPCFMALGLICPTSIFLGIFSAYMAGNSQLYLSRHYPSTIWAKIRICFAFLVFLQGVVEITCSMILEHHRSPSYLLTMAVISTAWFLHTICLYKMRWKFAMITCMPLNLVVCVFLTLGASTVQLYSTIVLTDKLKNPLHVADYGVLVRFFFQFSFLIMIFPFERFISRSHHRYGRRMPPVIRGTIQESIEHERDALLNSDTHGVFYSGFRTATQSQNIIAEDGSNILSKITFWWVKPLMVLGSNGKLQRAEDLFLLPHNVTTCYAREKFGFHATRQRNLLSDYELAAENTPCSDVSKQKKFSLLKVLHNAFGKLYYSIGILKLLGDCLGFAGPLLLHALVSFIENKNEPVYHGYYYAGGLFLSQLLGALISSQYSYQVNKVGLQVRASMISNIYSKSLSVSLTSLSAFSSGEVVNFMSTDTDRVVNFCPSFHEFWSLPFQVAVSLYLLHTQVGLAFLAGLGFAILLVPINRWLAIKIGQLSEDMMRHKDSRVKVMSEILYGIRVIKFYAWEKHFTEKISQLRKAELKSLKGRKYLDAWCVYFWATTPVVISLLTFATFVLMGNKLTAAKVFTSVALFSMLISPLNAFPWVINGLIEAWVSLKRVQSFLSLHDLDLHKYYTPILPGHPQYQDDNCIEIKSGTFQWSKISKTSDKDDKNSEAPEASNQGLYNLSLSIPRGNLIGVVGKVGSGKSSLLSAITAEMNKTHGQVCIKDLDKGFGLVTQEAWIQQGTVRDNIVFGRSYLPDKYNTVLHACALQEDLSILPAGDLTEVGENGVTLSGGQKARIALARAVYQDKDFYLLDDPLSAVDAHVASHLFQHCIMGLLKGKTIILCTHHTKFLSNADTVLMMDSGKVLHAGKPHDVLSQDMLQVKALHDGPENASVSADEEQDKEDNEETQTIEQDKGGLVEEEERDKGVVKLHVYKSYWKAVGHCLSSSILVSLLLMQASRNLSDWWLAYWISHTPADNSTTDSHLNKSVQLEPWLVEDNNGLGTLHIQTNSVTFYLIVYGGMGVANSIFTLFRAFLFAYGGICAAKVLHIKLFKNILSAPVAFFDTTPIGRIINRFSSDMYSIDDSLPFIMNIFFAQVYGVAGTIAITCYGLPWFTLVLVPLALIYYYIQSYYRRTSREVKRLMSITLSPVYAHFSETLTGLSTIRALRQNQRFSAENEKRLETNQRARFAGIIASQWLTLRLQFLGVAMVTGVAFIAVIQHHFTSVNPGLVGLAISYALSVTGRLCGLVTAFTETEKEMVSVERAQQYIEGVKPEKGGQYKVSSSWPQHSWLEFKNVVLIYRSGLPPALKGVSFVIAPAEKVGIVGRTGGGKSSLFQVLFHMVNIESGQVTIDGVDIASLPLDVLRSHLAIIPQDPFLFSGEVRLNLDPIGKFEDTELWTVLEKCHLKETIQKFGGLDQEVGEKGQQLSVGQRQLVCLARALLTQSKVLCIDEATASVDHETDKLLQQTIREEFKNSTVLTIAHRIETILDSDRVLVMEQGQVAEFDSPSILLNDKQSVFYSLVHSQ